ncbi:unnamed protein product, partial [Tetraodon nigroviridis]
IEEALTAAGKSHLFTRLSYPGAGHLIEPPYTPNSRASLWSTKPKKCEHRPRTGGRTLKSPITALSVSTCSDHAVGGPPWPSRCCPGGFLGQDPGFHGAEPEEMRTSAWNHTSVCWSTDAHNQPIIRE